MATEALVDGQINEHLVLLSNLYARKNSFSPTFRLPPETLENIFIHAARDYYHEGVHYAFCVPRWVNVSYVCRHWRKVALNCPPLWTYYFLVSSRWTEELLARSKQASLKIPIYFDYSRAKSWCLGLVEKLFNHEERIQEFIIHAPRAVLPPELSFRAPRLQVLEIDGYWSQPPEWTSTIVHGDTPLLRILKLTRCPLQWHSLNVSGLTTLLLCCIPAPFQRNAMEFLALLKSMQSLKALHVEHALVSSRGDLSSGAFNPSLKITLPFLARLFIRESLSTVVALLSRIDFPLKTEVRLEFRSEDGSSIEDYSQIPSVLAQRFNQAEDLSSFSRTIRSLVIRSPSHLDEATFSFSLSEHGDPTALLMAYPPRSCIAPLVVLVQTERLMTTADGDHLMSNICLSLPLTYIQTLHFVDPPSSLHFWETVLGHLRGLRHLKLSDGFMPNLISFLALAADEPVEGPGGTNGGTPTQGHTYIPALETLELHRIKFAPGDDSSLGSVVSEQSLLDALSTRNAPHARLVMIECGDVQDDQPDTDEDVYDEEGFFPYGFYAPGFLEEYS